MSSVVVLVFVLPLITAVIFGAFRTHLTRRVAEWTALATAAADSGLCFYLLHNSERRLVVEWFGKWGPKRGGLGIAFVVDPQGVVLAAFVSVIVIAALVFSLRYFEDVSRTYHLLMMIFLAAMCGFCLAGDAFNLFVMFELMSAVAFALTAVHVEASSLEGAFNFGVVNGAAALLMLIGIGFLYARAGALNLAAMSVSLAPQTLDALIIMSLALVVTGLWVKGAIVPFHFWLTDAHAVAATPVCVIFSGIMVALWLYGVTHFFWIVYGPMFIAHRGGLRIVMLFAGSVTAIMGALMSLAQRHIKRMLAFSTISHMGIVLIGFGLIEHFASAAAVLYVVGHGLVKASLFLCAGILLHRFGDLDELRLYGRGRSMPLIAICWIVAGLLLASIPPFGVWLGAASIDEELKRAGFEWMSWIIVFGEAVTGAAVLRTGVRVFAGRGGKRGIENQGPTEKQTRETSGSSGIPVVMVMPVVVLLLLALALPAWRVLPRLLRSGTEVLQDHSFYTTAVLSGDEQVPHPMPDAPFPTGYAHGLIAAGGAIVIAFLMLTTGFTEAWPLSTMFRAFSRLHSGRPGDYIAMIIVGVAGWGAAMLWLIR